MANGTCQILGFLLALAAGFGVIDRDWKCAGMKFLGLQGKTVIVLSSWFPIPTYWSDCDALLEQRHPQ